MKKDCNIKLQSIRDAFIIVVNASFQNPSFASQSKERCDLRVEKFGFTYSSLSSALRKPLERSEVIEDFMRVLQTQEDKDLKKSVQSTKKQKTAIPKYQKALKNHASLYVTEGDSAMAMALSGFSSIG